MLSAVRKCGEQLAKVKELQCHQTSVAHGASVTSLACPLFLVRQLIRWLAHMMGPDTRLQIFNSTGQGAHGS